MAIYGYLCTMISNKITPEELWSRQRISSLDIDYDLWSKKRETIIEFSQMSQSCIFLVDVFKNRYDFASENFSQLFGYNPVSIKTIKEQGDVLEERIHPDDRSQLIENGCLINVCHLCLKNIVSKINQMEINQVLCRIYTGNIEKSIA